MLNFIRKLAALVLLLVIPLQGVAASSLSILQCPPAEVGVAYSPNGDEGAAQDRNDDASNKFQDHFFCHQPASGIPMIVPAAGVTSDLPVFVSSVSRLSSLFFPEQPQRPPFSASA